MKEGWGVEGDTIDTLYMSDFSENVSEALFLDTCRAACIYDDTCVGFHYDARETTRKGPKCDLKSSTEGRRRASVGGIDFYTLSRGTTYGSAAGCCVDADGECAE